MCVRSHTVCACECSGAGRACWHSTCLGGFRVQIRAHTNNGDMTKIRQYYMSGGAEAGDKLNTQPKKQTPATSNHIKRYTIAAGCPIRMRMPVRINNRSVTSFVHLHRPPPFAVWRVLTLRSGIRRWPDPKQIASIINRLSLWHLALHPADKKNNAAPNPICIASLSDYKEPHRAPRATYPENRRHK